jgi:hypothetical protein
LTIGDGIIRGAIKVLLIIVYKNIVPKHILKKRSPY